MKNLFVTIQAIDMKIIFAPITTIILLFSGFVYAQNDHIISEKDFVFSQTGAYYYRNPQKLPLSLWICKMILDLKVECFVTCGRSIFLQYKKLSLRYPKSWLLARKSGIQIIYLKVAIQPDLSDLGDDGSPYRSDLLHVGAGDTITAPNGSKSRIQIRDTWNTDIVDELKPQINDIVIYKSRFSGFYKTELGFHP